MQIGVQVTALLQEVVSLSTTTLKCSRKASISASFSWKFHCGYQLTFSQTILIVWSGNSGSALCVNAKDTSINTRISETGSSTKITVAVVVTGLFCTCQDLGRRFDELLPACSFLSTFFLFLREYQLARTSSIPVPFFRPGSVHCGSASRDDSSRAFPDELRGNSLP